MDRIGLTHSLRLRVFVGGLLYAAGDHAGPPLRASAEIQSFSLDLLFVPYAEAQGARDFDVLGLAVQKLTVFIGFGESDGSHAFFRALGIQHLPAGFVESHGIRREVEGVMRPEVLPVPSAGTSMVHAEYSIEHVQHCLLADHRKIDNCGDKNAARIQSGAGMAPADVVHQTV